MTDTKVTKLSLDFTAEDMKMLNKLRSAMEKTQGRVSVVAVVRAAIRTAASK